VVKAKTLTVTNYGDRFVGECRRAVARSLQVVQHCLHIPAVRAVVRDGSNRISTTTGITHRP